MGREARSKKLRWLAYSHAATACAVFLGKKIRVGDIDLSRDYRTQKLEEIGQAMGLDPDTHYIPSEACLILNWPTLAQCRIGRPSTSFVQDTFAEIACEDDPFGVECLKRHWRAIEIVAETLLSKGRLTEAEATALLAGNAFNPKQYLLREIARQISPRFERLH